MKRRERLELSKDASDADEVAGSDEEREDQVKIKQALTWKRRHFFTNSLVVSLFLMVKLEFSYTEVFGRNILAFLISFTFIDIFLEQLLTRIVMSEALLVAPILGSFVLTEFIMTMGAEDFQSFIISYFIEVGLIVSCRTYLGPLIERAEILHSALRHQTQHEVQIRKHSFQGCAHPTAFGPDAAAQPQ